MCPTGCLCYSLAFYYILATGIHRKVAPMATVLETGQMASGDGQFRSLSIQYIYSLQVSKESRFRQGLSQILGM
jgi:hypothetical protein